MPRVSSGIGAGGSPCARRMGAILPMILERNGSLTSLRAERVEGCEMAKMSTGDLKALLSAERYDALSAMAASKLSDERASALNYYMGNMSKDMPAKQGGLERRRRHHRRPDAAADGDLRRGRGGGAVRAGRTRGRRRRRAGDRLRQPRLHAAESRLPGALLLHQGCAPFEGRRGQGVVGVPPGGRAR